MAKFRSGKRLRLLGWHWEGVHEWFAAILHGFLVEGDILIHVKPTADES